MSAIKAIETKYKGYTFRSRLEARWAVYFDAIGVEWEYEAEGYELPNGKYYLPDFVIDGGTFVEVKPCKDALPFFEKAREFVAYSKPGTRLLCLGGAPDYCAYPLWVRASDEIFDLLSDEEKSEFKKHLHVDLGYGTLWKDGVLHEVAILNDGRSKIWIDTYEQYWPWKILDKNWHSSMPVEAARSARFEHGRRG